MFDMTGNGVRFVDPFLIEEITRVDGNNCKVYLRGGDYAQEVPESAESFAARVLHAKRLTITPTIEPRGN